MNWNKITSIEQLEELKNLSVEKTVFIFKHSTRCSISVGALNRIERKWSGNEPLSAWYLDLLAHRDVSNKIATDFNVEHQSPQVLIIKNKKCIYTSSHLAIEYASITEVAAAI